MRFNDDFWHWNSFWGSAVYAREQIDVSKNHVRSVKKNFYKPPVELDLSENRLKKLPAAKSKKKNYIHSLDASRNALTKIPTNINNLVCMTRLDLSNNNLQEVRWNSSARLAM